MRDAGHRPPALGGPGERLGHPGDHRRLDRSPDLRHPVRPAGGRRARRLLGRRLRHQPRHRRPQGEEPAEPAGGRDRGRDRHGGGERPGGDGGRAGGGSRRGPQRHQADRRHAEGPPRAGGQAEAPVREEGGRPGRRGGDRGRPGRAAPGGRADQGQDRVLRADEEGQGRVRRVHPRGPAGEEGGLRLRLRRPAREAAQAGDLRERPPARRAAVRRGPGDRLRGGRPAAHSRLGALHPRRDPGPGDRDPGHLRGLPDHRHRAGGRVPQALHAALQLPALLGRAR